MTRVLFVNQTGTMSGAEHSLLDLLAGLPPSVVLGVACPDGQLADALAEAGIRRWPLVGTDVSFRLHPRHTARGLARIAVDAVRLRRLMHRERPDLVHANTTRAGLIALLASALGGPPVLVHVRDWLPESRLARVTIAAVALRARAMIANSAHISRQVPRGPKHGPVRVIHNPVDAARFDPSRVDRREARARLGIAEDALVIAVVGQLTPWKGQDDAVRVLGRLHERHPNLLLLLAGSAKFADRGTRFDNRAYDRDLRALIDSLGVGEAVLMLGERADVPEVIRATDVLLVPSWQEAFGRVALEGMAMAVPVVVTDHGGPAELVTDGREGRVLAPRDPAGWSVATDELLADAGRRAAIGARGREHVLARFTIAAHTAQVMALYDEVLP